MKKLPDDFLAMLSGLGLGKLGDCLAEGEPSTSVRLNRSRGVSREETGLAGESVAWCPEGIYLDERPKFTFDPRLHQGCYYVQEASSMFHSHVIASLTSCGTPLRVLDACAAPGGKTTAVSDSLPAGSLIVANEYVPARAAVLRENIIKWGNPSTIVTRGDTAAFRHLKGSFDIIIADVPCSGEGMMRKDDEAVAQWSPGLVRECVERQHEIVGNLWPALKPGGLLIYSTCTFNRSEDEEMVEELIRNYGAESVPVEDIKPEWGIAPAIGSEAHCYRFFPDRLRGEGLFVAVVRKPGEARQEKIRAGKEKKSGKKASQQCLQALSWLDQAANGDLCVYEDEDRVSAFPAAHIDMLKKVKKELDVIHEGVLVGNIKGRDLIPSQSLALSPLLRRGAFPEVDMDRTAALAYLSGEAVSLPEGTPKGFILLTYGARPLGFVKNIGNRSNNLYPAPWRIKSKIN